MHNHDLIRYLVFIATVSFSCRTSPTGPHVTSNIELSANDVECTEVWLKLSFIDSSNSG